MANIETAEYNNKEAIKPLYWKRYIDDIISIWVTGKEQIYKTAH